MTYVIVDPFLLRLPSAESASQEEKRAFINALLGWSKLVVGLSVTLRVSASCSEALKELYGSNSIDYMRVKLNKIREQSGLVSDQPTFDKALNMFFNSLEGPYVDADVDEARKNELVLWDVLGEEVEITPEYFVTRLEHELLESAYRQTLGEITFARNNKILPVAILKKIFIASRLNVNPPIAPLESGSSSPTAQAKVVATCEIVVDEQVERASKLKGSKRFQTHFDLVYSAEELAERMGVRKHFKNVLEAVRAAVDDYGDAIILPSKAEATAANCGYEDPDEIYELVCGLVTVWLVAYQKKQDPGAAYYEKFQREYSANESQTVSDKDVMRQDRTVTYRGDSYYCERHIKVGTGPKCVRINFEVVEEDDTYKIIIARAGTHGRNTKT